MLPAPPRRVLVDDVYSAVRGLLMDHVIAPGSRASIEGIARVLEVSPTPVREALARLESEGLVTKVALRGYRAAELLDAEGVRQLFQMRIWLEPQGARLAAGRMSPDSLAELGRLLDITRAEYLESIDEDGVPQGFPAFIDRDAEFHRIIMENSGNVLLDDAVIRLRSHQHLYRLMFGHGVADVTLAEHEAILEALRVGDRDEAHAQMESHISASLVRASEQVT